jgi:Ras family protein V
MVAPDYGAMWEWKGTHRIHVSVVDTAGQEEFERLRVLFYPHTNVFLICFSIKDKNTFKNAIEKWLPEIKRYEPEAAFILVGTEAEARQDPELKSTLVKAEDALKIAKNKGFYSYVEVSARLRQGMGKVIDDVLDSHYDAYIRKNNPKRNDSGIFRQGHASLRKIFSKNKVKKVDEDLLEFEN